MKSINHTKMGMFLVVLLAASVLFINGAFAQLTNPDLPNREGIKIWKMGETKGHAAVGAAAQYDSNIFLNNTDRKADEITILSPSGGVEVPFGENSISADYRADIYYYAKFPDQNHVDQFVRGLIEAPLKDFILTVKDVFSIVTNRANNEDSSRIRQNNNNLRAGVSAEFDLLKFDAGYTNFLETYASDDIVTGTITYNDKSRFSNIADLTVSYRFMPKTSIFLENLLGFVDYYKCGQVPNSIFEQAAVGIKGEWFQKADIDFKAGFRYQGYKYSDVFAHKSYIGAIIGGGMDYRPTDDDAIAINLLRTVYESTYANMNYYISNFAGIEYRHMFSDKVSAALFGSYEFHQYPSESTENGVTAKRYDNYLRGGASVRYDLRKWVSLEGRYEYTNRISKFDIFDYVDNQATIRGTVGF